MANMLQKLGVLIWKSFVIRKRHWIVTLLELCVPVLLFIGLAYLNSHVSNYPISEPEHVFERRPEYEILKDAKDSLRHILYTPVNSVTNELMELVKIDLRNAEESSIYGVKSESEMETIFKQLNLNDSIDGVFGIVFHEDVNIKPVKFLNYKIRSIGTPYSYTSSSLFANLFDAFSPDYYEQNGFLGLQIILNRCFMKYIGIENNSTFSVQKFPTPYLKDKTGKIIIHELLPLTTVISFIFLCPAVLKRIVEEKQTGVKELMKLMGLPSILLWLSWFIHAMSIAVVSITIITCIVGIPISGSEPVLLCSSYVVWTFIFLYCMSSVCFLFAVSAFFKKPTMALVFGLLVWLGSGIATKFITGGHMDTCCKLLSCLLPNIAVVWGYQSIFVYENRELSMGFGDVFNPSTAMGGSFQMGQIWVILIVQCVLYFVIAMYLEAIFPGDYGVAKPWYFPFMDCLKWVRVAPLIDMKGENLSDTETFEPLAESLPVGIKIRKLRKVFKSPWNQTTKVSVDGLSLDICKEQITVLLGHNGAGKSTTMMILTGMLSPTSGTVEINGYDIKYNMNKIRKSLGLCPQHNLLFPDLTVQEHLYFFAKLKGSSEEDPDLEVSLYAKKLNLIPHLNKTPTMLSGGYKRRLCLALAFIGQSKTIILDEPTSGLDPEARREIWDLLLSMRGSRTILITTHIMEEADVLGDRIAIMDHGQVQCYGTPMYLKKLYGTGYILSILKKNSSDSERIEAAVKDVIPEAELKSSVASLMTFCLPDEKRFMFPELFALLQRERLPLGVESVGVSITTLEEVFLRVGEIALEESGKNEDLTSELSEKSECSLQPLNTPRNIKGIRLWFQQVHALFVKRALVMNFSYLIQVVIMILVIMLVTMISLRPFGGNPIPPLHLDLSLYGKTNVLFKNGSELSHQFLSNYKSLVTASGSTVELLPPEMNIISELLKKGYKDRESYVFSYIVAADLNRTDKIVALYSDLALHSLPISVNLLANALITFKTNDHDYGISIINHPFQIDEPEYLQGDLVSLLWMALVPVALTFWMGLFVILPMEERISSSRQLQSMAGVSVYTYWFCLYVWDLLLHLLLSVTLVVTIMIIDNRGVFSETSEIVTLLIIFMLYGISAIPFSYFASFWKDTWAGCYSVLVIVNIIAGFILVFIIGILHTFDVKSADGLQSLLRLVPNFAFTQILYQFVTQVMNNKACLRKSDAELKHMCSGHSSGDRCCFCVGRECYDGNRSYIEENETHLLYMGLSWILYMGLVFILDMGFFEWLWEKIVSQYGTSGSLESTGNDDVDGEAQSVEELFKNEGTSASADLLVNNLQKKYGIIPKPLAVKGVSFHVKPGECFGLLGVNGAGKTTTFKMLTGAIVPTQGVAAIAGYRSDKNKHQYLSQIGYCPQHDALIECLSAYRTLWFYGALRGVPKENLNQEVQRWIHMMGLREYRNKSSGTFSGGNKRKLMAAMALIGGPPLVFLDEPTSGVDPVARRNLWNSLVSLQKAGQSIVLTSHSMEECEALCNRLGIMVGGQLMCMGNIPYLKNKYKQGSTVKLKLRAGGSQDAIERIKKKMETAFSLIVMKDAHETLLHYQVTDTNLSWGTMFETMEKLKQECDIVEDYTISETTLEEVFLSFAQTLT